MPAQIKITKRTVDRITGDGSDRFYWDDDLPGFGKYDLILLRAPLRIGELPEDIV